MSKIPSEVVTIAELRAKKGKLSQKQLALALGTSQTNISRWEKDIMSISVPYLEKICTFFGVPSEKLLGF